MNFDAKGRLWVASSEVYPQIKPGEVANDKVVILEDTDSDGKADKTTVFADKLLIPTGVEPGDGGAYVANSTELVHLADTDGDGKADVREVVLSGFGTEDTHHILHTLRWGPDGMLYFNQSIYIHSHVETPWGVRRLGGGGIWQFRPESAWLDIFARGWWNPWGHHFDRWGPIVCHRWRRRPGDQLRPARRLLRRHPRGQADRRRPQPGQPQVLRRGDPQRPAPARRLARQRPHQRLPRQQRPPIPSSPTTAPATPPATCPT